IIRIKLESNQTTTIAIHNSKDNAIITKLAKKTAASQKNSIRTQIRTTLTSALLIGLKTSSTVSRHTQEQRHFRI
ncbi:MAG: hypothetical protein J6Q59_06195, partial [Paludibacteraceae bacterium]|nr:hypothetical protein [Paludibacteraceae bacterium]